MTPDTFDQIRHRAGVTSLVACHECGLLQREVPLVPGMTTRCGRCGTGLYRAIPAGVDKPLALTLTAAIVFLIANAFPIVGLQIQDTRNDTTLLGAVVTLWRQDMWAISLLVLGTTVLAPAIEITVFLRLLLAIKTGRKPASLTAIMRLLGLVNPWGMIEVFMLGVLVSLVKLTHFAKVIPGLALGAFAVLTVLLAAVASSIDLRAAWNLAPVASRDNKRGGRCSEPPASATGPVLSCHLCGLVSRVAEGGGTPCCPRCGAELHHRKRDSLSRSWAFLIAACILYVPANILPIMETGSLFGYQSDTIMSGVVYLWHSGSWDLALVVFVASIMVPLLKLIAMTFLLVSVQWKSKWQPVQRTRLYRIVEFIGRWSMLDIYVVTILAALVQIGSLATITAGSGAMAFGAVVVLTMFAAMSFDPRLIWDSMKKANPEYDRKPS